MPTVRAPRDSAGRDFALAESIMSVAESRSLEALGIACHAALQRLTGARTIGVYLLNGEEPHLLYSRHVPEGFLEEYKTEFGRNDPLLQSILSQRGAVDGASLLGSHNWPRSQICDLLRRWGFSYNMCGPLRYDERPIGVIYTATRDPAAPYTSALRERMEMLCRAGSLALSNMIEGGHLADRPDRWPRTAEVPPPAADGAHLLGQFPPRAAEVAMRVCRGQTNKEIAREMGISDHTVKEHVASLCRRTGVHNRTELAARLLGGARRQ